MKQKTHNFMRSVATKVALQTSQIRNPEIDVKTLRQALRLLYKEATSAGFHEAPFSDSKVYSWVDEHALFVLTHEEGKIDKTKTIKALEEIAEKFSVHKNITQAHLYAWKHFEGVAKNLHERKTNVNPADTKIFAVDIDGVLYDVDGVMWRWLVNKGYTPPAHEVRTYNMAENWGISHETIQEEFGLAVDSGFMFRYGDSYRESVNAVTKIYNKGHKVVLVTARNLPGRELKCRQATMKWLRENNVPYDELHLTHEKEKVTFDFLIDDAPSNVERVVAWGKKGYILHRPWNKDEGLGYNKGTWVDFLYHANEIVSQGENENSYSKVKKDSNEALQGSVEEKKISKVTTA